MFVLVVLSLVLCFTALMYLLFHKDESFKDALSFTIVLLVRGAGGGGWGWRLSGGGAGEDGCVGRRVTAWAQLRLHASCGPRPLMQCVPAALSDPPLLLPTCRSRPSPLPLRLCAPPPWRWAPASCRRTAPL